MKGKSLISVLPDLVAAALKASPGRLALRQALPALVLLALLAALPTQALAQQNRLGPVSAEQTLWSIASQNRPDTSISVYQYMLALVEANPHAFAAGNANLMREGVILDLPDAEFATRVSPAEAQRRIEEQIQWYANLSRQELLDVLRSDPPSRPAPSTEFPTGVADTEQALVDEPPAVDYEIDQDRVVDEAESQMPELLAPVSAADLADRDIPELAAVAEDEWQAAEALVEDTTDVLTEERSTSELVEQAEAMLDDWLPADSEVTEGLPEISLPETVESMPSEFAEAMETVEPMAEELEATVSEALAPESDWSGLTVTTQPESIEETEMLVPPAPVAEQATPPQAQPTPAAPAPAPSSPVARSGPGTLFWVIIGLFVLIALTLLAWRLRGSSKAKAEVDADDDELDEVDESRFPTAASAAAAALADGDEEMGQSAEQDQAGTRTSTASDDWSGLEAAVIGGGPVPIGDPDPQAAPEADAWQRRQAVDEAPADDAPTTTPAVEQDALQEQTRLDGSVEDTAGFEIEELGWFEEESMAPDSDEQESDELGDELVGTAVNTDDADTHPQDSQSPEIGSPADEAPNLEEVDLANFRSDRDDESETDEAAADEVLLDELDLAELDIDEDHTPPAASAGTEVDFAELPDLDSVSEGVPDSESERTNALEDASDSVLVDDEAAADLSEAEALTELGFDWDLGSASQPEPESVPVSPVKAALEDSEAEVMLDLARLTADAGDAEYAREVLDEVIATGSEEMAQRARELKDSLG